MKDFKLGGLRTSNKDSRISREYSSIENCKIVVQSVKISAGKGRLYPTKDTVSKKNCVIMVKNDDTICFARAIVAAYANLKSERWSNTQLKKWI